MASSLWYAKTTKVEECALIEEMEARHKSLIESVRKIASGKTPFGARSAADDDVECPDMIHEDADAGIDESEEVEHTHDGLTMEDVEGTREDTDFEDSQASFDDGCDQDNEGNSSFQSDCTRTNEGFSSGAFVIGDEDDEDDDDDQIDIGHHYSDEEELYGTKDNNFDEF